MTLADWITNIEWYGATLASVLFVLLYMRTRWWKRWEGRVVMALHSVIIGFALLGVLYRIVGPDYIGKDVLRVTFFGLWFVVMWAFVGLLISAQRHGKRTLSERPDES